MWLAVMLPLLASGAGLACRESDSLLAGAPGLETVVLAGAGDIATCVKDDDEATASALDTIGGFVFTTGDNLHDAGPGASFQTCYEPNWGRHLSRTFPAIGNYDYEAGGSDSYFEYFGERAGPRGLGYYSFNLGSWHVIVLNSNADRVATHRGSAQEQWLRADLAAHRSFSCVLAIWHHPRFYHGPWNRNLEVKPFWDALSDAGADVVVNGHFHLYERYAPQDPDGNPDPVRGIRQFTVGTGGRGHDVLYDPAPNLEVRDNTTYGVLKLTLEPGSYSWEFVPANGGTFSDSGSASCH
jgi:hypothetical protein